MVILAPSAVAIPLQSVAVRFDEGVDEREQIEELLSRLAVTVFAGIMEEGDEYIHVSIYSSLGTTGLSGMANLFIPILIAALIVLNTMMGSVYERFREIGVYSSVGPRARPHRLAVHGRVLRLFRVPAWWRGT